MDCLWGGRGVAIILKAACLRGEKRRKSGVGGLVAETGDGTAVLGGSTPESPPSAPSKCVAFVCRRGPLGSFAERLARDSRVRWECFGQVCVCASEGDVGPLSAESEC